MKAETRLGSFWISNATFPGALRPLVRDATAACWDSGYFYGHTNKGIRNQLEDYFKNIPKANSESPAVLSIKLLPIPNAPVVCFHQQAKRCNRNR